MRSICQIVDLDVSRIRRAAVGNTNSKRRTIGAKGHGGPAGIEGNVVTDRAPITGGFVVVIHADKCIVAIVGVRGIDVLIPVFAPILFIEVSALTVWRSHCSSEVVTVISSVYWKFIDCLIVVHGQEGRVHANRTVQWCIAQRIVQGIANVHGALSTLATVANGNGNGVAVLAQGDAGGAFMSCHLRSDAYAFPIPPPTRGGILDVLQNTDLMLLSIGTPRKAGVDIFEDVAIRKADGGRSSIAGQRRMAGDKVRKACLDAPPSIYLLIHPSTKHQCLGIPTQLNTKIKVVRTQNIVLLDPRRFVPTQFKYRGHGGADAADGIGIVRHGQCRAVGTKADASGAPNVDDAGPVHPPLTTVQLVGEYGGLVRVGHGEAVAVGAEDGDRAREGPVDEGPLIVGLTAVHLDGSRLLGADGNVGGIGREGYGRSQCLEVGIFEVHVLEPG